MLSSSVAYPASAHNSKRRLWFPDTTLLPLYVTFPYTPATRYESSNVNVPASIVVALPKLYGVPVPKLQSVDPTTVAGSPICGLLSSPPVYPWLRYHITSP